MRRSKEKSLPKWLEGELKALGWNKVEVANGSAWVKDGEMYQIVTLNNKQYHVTWQKMSERKVTIMTEVELIQTIEGES
jgi:sugar lactone lactonase YvrE